jgi:hypothetical protein
LLRCRSDEGWLGQFQTFTVERVQTFKRQTAGVDEPARNGTFVNA